MFYKGVATRFREDQSSRAIYVHCYGHILNLITKDCISEVPVLRNTLGTIQSLYTFLEASPKRHAMFMKNGDSDFVKTLKSNCKTRWTAHESSRKAVEAELFTIIRTLSEISNDHNSKTSSEATSLLRSVCSFDFLFGMSVLKLILPHTSHLSAAVQSVDMDVLRVKENAELTIKTLESLRTNESFQIIWELTEKNRDRVKTLIETEEIDVDFQEANLPRQKPSTRRLGTVEASCENTVFTVENYNKVNNYIPALDRIISEFKSRFAENDSVVLCALANILTNENPDDEAFKEVAKFYTMDEDTIKSEHKMFNHMKKTLTDTKSVSGMLKQIADKQMMIMIPELFKLIKIFAVIPATSCSAERSFSSLRRLKTYLRNTMSQDRLTNLAVMTIEPGYVNRVLKEDMEKLINTFGSKSGRNTLFF